MQKNSYDYLARLVEEGEKAQNTREFSIWAKKVSSFLKTAMGTSDDFDRIMHNDDWKEHAMRIGHLQGLVALAESKAMPISTTAALSTEASTPLAHDTKKVFVVHGHDNEAKEGTARFLERLGLQPVILHEQASGGRTIVEKFEKYSGDVAFAVVLLTPDDVGNSASDRGTLRPRARQNVVLELGYFMGRLARDRVCALYKGGVELPSDIQGVIYVEMDAQGSWKAKLAQEFVQAKLPIDLAGLLGG